MLGKIDFGRGPFADLFEYCVVVFGSWWDGIVSGKVIDDGLFQCITVLSSKGVRSKLVRFITLPYLF